MEFVTETAKAIETEFFNAAEVTATLLLETVTQLIVDTKSRSAKAIYYW